MLNYIQSSNLTKKSKVFTSSLLHPAESEQSWPGSACCWCHVRAGAGAAQCVCGCGGSCRFLLLLPPSFLLLHHHAEPGSGVSAPARLHRAGHRAHLWAAWQRQAVFLRGAGQGREVWHRLPGKESLTSNPLHYATIHTGFNCFLREECCSCSLMRCHCIKLHFLVQLFSPHFNFCSVQRSQHVASTQSAHRQTLPLTWMWPGDPVRSHITTTCDCTITKTALHVPLQILYLDTALWHAAAWCLSLVTLWTFHWFKTWPKTKLQHPLWGCLRQIHHRLIWPRSLHLCDNTHTHFFVTNFTHHANDMDSHYCLSENVNWVTGLFLGFFPLLKQAKPDEIFNCSSVWLSDLQLSNLHFDVFTVPPLSQVIAGGNYDVDSFVTDPLNNVLYNEKKKQYDSFSHTTAMKGVYKVCFSNEFSTFTHKIVYLEFRYGDEKPLLQSMTQSTALTQVRQR